MVHGRFLCSKCRDKERDKIAAYLMVKFPGDTGQDKLARVLEGMRALMASHRKIFFHDGRLVLNVKNKYFYEILNGRKVKEVPETYAVLDEADRGEDVRYR